MFQPEPGPPAGGPGVHSEGDGQGSCFFLGVPGVGEGRRAKKTPSNPSSEAHSLLGGRGWGACSKPAFSRRPLDLLEGGRIRGKEKGRELLWSGESEGFPTEEGEGLSCLRKQVPKDLPASHQFCKILVAES